MTHPTTIRNPLRRAWVFLRGPSGTGRPYRKYRLAVLALVVVLALLPVAFVVRVVSKMPNLQSLENPQVALSTQVFSADGELLGTYYRGEQRISVQRKDVPQNLHDALIATEDIRFYDHSGIDPVFVLSGFWRNVVLRQRSGGSGLTQQLARNLYNDAVGRDNSIARKIREAIAAVVLERRYTKDEILVYYLNTVPFGGDLYGIEAAAKSYFGKATKDLTTPESALLIGLLKGPTEYSPYKHPDRAKNRRNTVLDQMLKYGYLTENQAQTLKQQELGVVPRNVNQHDAGLAPHFREHLREWLTEWASRHNVDVYASGLRVYTTLNARMQRYAEQSATAHLVGLQKVFERQLKGREPWRRDTSIIWRGMRQSARFNQALSGGKSMAQARAEFNEKVPMRVFAYNQQGYIDTTMAPRDSVIYYLKFLEVGVMTVNPTNGHILAWVGGLDHRFFKYDHVHKARRQVGSTFKPFVYTAAFDNGFSPCHEEPNLPLEMESGGKMWAPQNADRSVGGTYTLRRALAMSVNIITARVIKSIGARVVVDYAKKMGIESELEAVPAISLGTPELSLYELTGAYGTFADKGRWHEPIFVSRVEDKFGNVLENFVGNSREALSEETAYLMVDMLRGVVNYGTAGGLRGTYKLEGSIDIGGKTGTTQKHADGWFVGFTPYFCTGVWVGAADRSVAFPDLAYGQGGRMAMPVWGRYMAQVYEDKELNVPRTFFERPKQLKVETDCSRYKRQRQDDTEVNPYNITP